jgi:hypothetical protein
MRVGPCASQAFLPFKSERAAVCKPCLNYCSLAALPATIAETLRDSAEEHAAYMRGLASYEAAFNESASGRVKSADIDRYEVKVKAKTKVQLKLTQNLGIFWPRDLYKKLKHAEPEKGKLVKARIGETTYLGVVLDEAVHGYPMGAYRMENAPR